MKKLGFTLVELSIVLVIIGLLIGGILIGQSLIESAKINAQIKQYSQYDILMGNFKSKYKQMPGDCNICSTTYGNNNGKLEGYSSTAVPPFRAEPEPSLVFAQLYNMGLVVTRYVDVSSSNGYGKNNEAPAAAIGRGGLFVTSNNFSNLFYGFAYTTTTGSGTADLFANILAQGNLSPKESLALDAKLDDGKPTSGDVFITSATAASSTSFAPFTADTDSASTCVYNSNYNTALAATNLCRLVAKSNYN